MDDRVRRLYLERINHKVKKMRKLLAERNWRELRSEFSRVRTTAKDFGFPELYDFAERAEKTIPEGAISRAHHLPEAQDAAEHLISAIDGIILDERRLHL